jgi:hypothetical protein
VTDIKTNDVDFQNVVDFLAGLEHAFMKDADTIMRQLPSAGSLFYNPAAQIRNYREQLIERRKLALLNRTGPMATQMRKQARITELLYPHTEAKTSVELEIGKVAPYCVEEGYLIADALNDVLSKYISYVSSSVFNPLDRLFNSTIFEDGVSISLLGGDPRSVDHAYINKDGHYDYLYLPFKEPCGSVRLLCVSIRGYQQSHHVMSLIYDALEDECYPGDRRHFKHTSVVDAIHILFAQHGWTQEAYNEQCWDAAEWTRRWNEHLEQYPPLVITSAFDRHLHRELSESRYDALFEGYHETMLTDDDQLTDIDGRMVWEVRWGDQSAHLTSNWLRGIGDQLPKVYNKQWGRYKDNDGNELSVLAHSWPVVFNQVVAKRIAYLEAIKPHYEAFLVKQENLKAVKE